MADDAQPEGHDRARGAAREALVRTVAREGVRDRAVLEAMAAVPRELFVDPSDAASAYDDHPLPIGHGQTISQPFIVALMAEAAELSGAGRVLEIGAGSGYAAAVFAQLTSEVYGVERDRRLVERARLALSRAGETRVTLRWGDGNEGWPEHAPYDAILVSAAAETIPEALFQQLAVGGRLVAPIGDPAGMHQELRRWRKRAPQRVDEETLCAVRFVPLRAGIVG
ncbi:MAG: protein-L-isoaspartate(D-aspartate) O-methyltransferase [Myxococcales bacterium]|nr:protein-L-isoaspartate(D-aspartate) O-methyltransferase [Myxococcales bacterium]